MAEYNAKNTVVTPFGGTTDGGARNSNYDTRKHRERVEAHTKFYDLELEFTPKKGQRKIIELGHNRNIRKIVVNVFRQYGKSFVCRYLALEWMQTPETVVGYVTQTSRLAKDIYKKFVNMFPDVLIKSKDGKDFIIELVNGSKLIFFSVEQTNAIRGFTLDYLIWDEVSHSREYTVDGEHIYYNIISPLMDAKGKKEIYISTPNGAQGFFYNESMKGLNGTEGYAYIKISVEDDETKSKKWIKEKREGYPEKAWEQEYLCLFLEDGVSFFVGFNSRFIDEFFDWDSKLYAGVDFSSVGDDDTVLTFMNEKKQTIQYVINGDLDTKYREIAKHLNKTDGKLVLCYFEKNSIGEVMGNEIIKLLNPNLKRKIEFITTTNSTKQDYIEKLALDIEQGNISFMEDNDILKEQFKVFTYKVSKTGKKIFNALEGFHDDTIISLALANLAHHKFHTKKTSGAYVIRT